MFVPWLQGRNRVGAEMRTEGCQQAKCALEPLVLRLDRGRGFFNERLMLGIVGLRIMLMLDCRKVLEAPVLLVADWRHVHSELGTNPNSILSPTLLESHSCLISRP